MLDMLNAVKVRLQITNTAFDAMFEQLIGDVVNYIVSAGVDRTVAQSPRAYGAVARGVLDLWNDNAGQGKFSNSFYELVAQMRNEVAND